MNSLRGIAEHFAGGQSVLAVEPLGNGLINDTYAAATATGRFVLQRLNSEVFARPDWVMANLRCLTAHAARCAETSGLQVPGLLTGANGADVLIDDQGFSWRALEYLGPSESREALSCPAEATAVGEALARFHRLCADLPGEALHDTLPGFHITPTYYQTYLQRLEQPLRVAADADFGECVAYIERHAAAIPVLEQAKQRGELVERVIHGDPKLNNFLFRPGSDSIIGLIDLDTVKPGLPHYDIGDCLRSCCHTDGDRFDLSTARRVLGGYLTVCGDLIDAAADESLYAAIWLIPFELGLRFFSDYLDGSRYFKVSDPLHNLRRALAQFRLCDSIAKQRAALESSISKARRGTV